MVALLPLRLHLAGAQTPGADAAPPFKVIVAPASAGDSSVVAVPPITSWQGAINFATSGSATPSDSDLSAWVQDQQMRNGLERMMTPWHIVIAYEQFDEQGDKVHSGTFEEFWAGPKRFKTTYKSDNLNQTDYATAQGLFRTGDQQWPNRMQVQVAREVIDPFSYAESLHGVGIHDVTETYGSHQLHCAAVVSNPGRTLAPTRYCFYSGALRYVKGFGWYQTAYNDIASLSEHFIAQSVDVYDGGHPYLKLRVQQIGPLDGNSSDVFTPPSGAILLSGKPVTGVQITPLQTGPPSWPDALRNEHFTVAVELLVGKDGKVIDAHAVSGPPAAYKSAEKTARAWTFQPYLLLGEPSEVNTKILLSNN